MLPRVEASICQPLSAFDRIWARPLYSAYVKCQLRKLTINILRYHSIVEESQWSSASRAEIVAGCLRKANHWTDQSPAEPRCDNDLRQPHISRYTNPICSFAYHRSALSGILLIANPKSAIEDLESLGKLLHARGRACRKSR